MSPRNAICAVIGMLVTGCSANRVNVLDLAVEPTPGDTVSLLSGHELIPWGIVSLASDAVVPLSTFTGVAPTPITPTYSGGCMTNHTKALVHGQRYVVRGGRPTLPVGFSRLERVDGKVELGQALSLGAGYNWFWGSATYNEVSRNALTQETDGSMAVDTDFYLGLAVSGGAREELDPTASQGTQGSFTGALFGGFKAFGGLAGYDLTAGRFFFGLAAKLDVFHVTRDSRTRLCIGRPAF